MSTRYGQLLNEEGIFRPTFHDSGLWRRSPTNNVILIDDVDRKRAAWGRHEVRTQKQGATILFTDAARLMAASVGIISAAIRRAWLHNDIIRRAGSAINW